MSLEVTEAELSALEYGQVDLQELLGEALVEVQHHRELQSINSKNLALLKDQAECAAAQADFVYKDLTQSNSQGVKELQREIVSKSCELSAAQLDLQCWKQQAAVQRLKLVSVQEDLSHQKLHTAALAAECSRRHEECNVAQAQLEAASAQNGQLQSELSQRAAALAHAQGEHAMLQAALQEKEGSMQALQTRLHEAQSKLEALEQSAHKAMQAAEQRHAAVEERARLSEQVAAAARERADMAEQRLTQRAELSQERQQHITDLTQERHTAAAERAAVTEKSLRSEVCSLQEALQKAQAARFRDMDAVSQELHGKLQRTQAELMEAQHQVAKRTAHIAVLEEACRHRDTSATPAKLAEQAMDTVSALVADLDVTEASLQGSDPPAAGPSPAPAAMASMPDKATRGSRGRAPAADKATAVTVYNRDNKRSTAVAVSDEQLTGKPAAGKKAPGANTGKATIVQEAAEEDRNGRSARQRGRAQPYWMGGAAPGSSPAPNDTQTNPSASDATQEDKPQPADTQQAVGHGGKSGMAGKAKKAPTVAKRQTRSSPHKELQQQQPAKRSRAASKHQQSEEQLQHEAICMEVGAEAAMEVGGAAEADQVTQQPANSGDEGRRAGGGAGKAQAEDSQSAGVQEAGSAEDVDRLQQQDVGAEPSAPQQPQLGAKGPSAAAAKEVVPDAIAGALKRFGLKHPTRPIGVAKIDLASSFTDASSPANALSGVTSKPTAAAGVVQAGASKPTQAAQGGKGTNKENEGESAPPGSSKAYLPGHKPVAQPPPALNARVVAAAAARGGQRVAAPQLPSAPANKDTSQPAVANKRKILKPVNVNYSTSGKHQDVLPANMLFGDAFMVPKLRR